MLNILLEADQSNDNVNLEILYYLNPIINIQKVENLFNSRHDNKNEIIKHHFMPKDLHLVNKRTVDISKFFSIAKKYIYPNFNCNIDPINKKICLIHIRSGDIFAKHIFNPSYVQPPLNYYKKIINDTSHIYDKFIIITEPDALNPCIKLLNNYLNKVIIQTSSVFNDYNILLKAHSIILSRSSFSDSTIFINPNLKNIYFWNYGHNLGNINVVPKNITILPYYLTEKYIEMGKWTHSVEQLKLMVNYPINSIINK